MYIFSVVYITSWFDCSPCLLWWCKHHNRNSLRAPSSNNFDIRPHIRTFCIIVNFFWRSAMFWTYTKIITIKLEYWISLEVEAIFCFAWIMSSTIGCKKVLSKAFILPWISFSRFCWIESNLVERLAFIRLIWRVESYETAVARCLQLFSYFVQGVKSLLEIRRLASIWTPYLCNNI